MDSEGMKNNYLLNHKVLIISSIIFSGLCWYFSNGLTGDYWFLLWIAPVPVIYISIQTKGTHAFLISFIAYLIGRFSWFSYLVAVATLVPAIIFTLALSLVFALIIVIVRKSIIKNKSWISVFAFPIFFTLFEFLLVKFSPDGSVASIAYSQSNVLPVIQIASVTGILGITFLLTFIPSAIAHLIFFKEQKREIVYILTCSIVILFGAIFFGVFRIDNSKQKTIKSGLVVLEEKYHDISAKPDFYRDTLVAQLYSNEIKELATKGAKIVVLPERAINIGKETDSLITGIFAKTAQLYHISIVIGYTNYKTNTNYNSALVIDSAGKVIADYNKIHLVTGLENQFAKGKDIGLFSSESEKSGVSICKDLDFPNYIRNYGKNSINILAIPAWDFEVDDWLHSRMAVLRGVENGFSEIRAARQGKLTISDCFGRVNYEASCSKGDKASLVGEVSLLKKNTVYTRFGDWFGFLIILAALFFGFKIIRK